MSLCAARRLIAGARLVVEFVVVLSILVAAPGVQAQAFASPPPPAEMRRTVTVSFDGPPTCDAGAEFVQAVERRLPHSDWELAERGSIRVTVEQSDTSELAPGEEDISRQETTATLIVLLEGGGSLRRTIGGASCEEAVEALAFITAIALDPGAAQRVRVRPTPKKHDEDERQSMGTEPPVTPPLVEDRWAWGLGLQARALLGPAPRSLVGGRAGVLLLAVHEGWWAPSLSVSLSYLTRQGFQQPVGTAHFSSWLGATDLCPSHGRWGLFHLRPCARIEAGGLIAEGTDTFAPRRQVRPWVTLGTGVILEMDLAPWLKLSTQGGLGIPLVRDTFQFDTDVFHAVPAVTGSVGGGIALVFP